MAGPPKRSPAATYDEGQSTARDRLRFKLGDTDMTAALFPDVTYNAVLERNGNDEAASLLELAQALRSKQARDPDKIVTGPDSQQYTDRQKNLADMVTGLTPKAVVSSGNGIGSADPYRDGY